MSKKHLYPNLIKLLNEPSLPSPDQLAELKLILSTIEDSSSSQSESKIKVLMNESSVLKAKISDHKATIDSLQAQLLKTSTIPQEMQLRMSNEAQLNEDQLVEMSKALADKIRTCELTSELLKKETSENSRLKASNDLLQQIRKSDRKNIERLNSELKSIRNQAEEIEKRATEAEKLLLDIIDSVRSKKTTMLESMWNRLDHFAKDYSKNVEMSSIPNIDEFQIFEQSNLEDPEHDLGPGKNLSKTDINLLESVSDHSTSDKASQANETAVKRIKGQQAVPLPSHKFEPSPYTGNEEYSYDQFVVLVGSFDNYLRSEKNPSKFSLSESQKQNLFLKYAQSKVKTVGKALKALYKAIVGQLHYFEMNLERQTLQVNMLEEKLTQGKHERDVLIKDFLEKFKKSQDYIDEANKKILMLSKKSIKAGKS